MLQSKRKANLLDLLRLRATKPVPAMATSLDVHLLSEEDLPDDLRDELQTSIHEDSEGSEEGGEGEASPREKAAQGKTFLQCYSIMSTMHIVYIMYILDFLWLWLINRVSQITTEALVVRIQALTVHILKCPWTRH